MTHDVKEIVKCLDRIADALETMVVISRKTLKILEESHAMNVNRERRMRENNDH